MTPELRSALSRQHVSLLGANAQSVRVRPLGRSTGLELEPYVQLRDGLYDAERIGAYTYLGGTNSVFRHVGRIGRFCAIAGGIMTGQAEHGISQLALHPMFSGNWSEAWPHLAQFYRDNAVVHRKAAHKELRSIEHRCGRIEIGNDVWIGYGAYIRRGVRIGDGAVIAAHSVVVNDVDPYCVVGGVPARVIRSRFAPEVVQELLQLQWWNKGIAALNGVDYTDPVTALHKLKANCEALPDWTPPTCKILADGSLVDSNGNVLHSESAVQTPEQFPMDAPGEKSCARAPQESLLQRLWPFRWSGRKDVQR